MGSLKKRKGSGYLSVLWANGDWGLVAFYFVLVFVFLQQFFSFFGTLVYQVRGRMARGCGNISAIYN